MTKAQQTACYELGEAQAKYLLAYGWEKVHGGWRHSKLAKKARVNNIATELVYDTFSAIAETRATPTLGWP